MGSGSREVEDLCRVCAKDKSNIQLFSESGMKHKLINKIKKYLSIVVLANDKLPLGICYGCAKKLDSIHRFVRNAQEAQNNLKDLMKYEKYHAQPDTSGSLLHSILTRGNNPEERNGMKSENMDEEDEEEEEEQLEVTKMEVDIDPMLFLVPDEDSQSDDKADVKETSSHLNNNVNEMYEKQERVKPYRCSICPRGFNTEIGLQNHLWSHLPTANRVLTKTKFQSLKDKGCVYSSNGVLRTASVAEPVVNNSGPLTCPVCGKLISTKGNLKVHLETHRPKGRYDCDICGRIFKTPSNLSRHKEYHEYVQFPCKVCGRVYPTNSTLRAHSITHSNLRPHKCPLCDKTFKRNQDLKFHINQHTGARPYQCPYCPKAFASSGNCFSHRKRMHSDEVERDRELAGGESE